MKTHPPEIEVIALRSMCRRAAAEIEALGECTSSNLLSRLCGNLAPDVYPAHLTAEEKRIYLDYIKTNEK
jgi:hypothetical protein